MSPFSRKKGARGRDEVPVGAEDGDSKMATLNPKDGTFSLINIMF